MQLIGEDKITPAFTTQLRSAIWGLKAQKVTYHLCQCVISFSDQLLQLYVLLKFCDLKLCGRSYKGLTTQSSLSKFH